MTSQYPPYNSGLGNPALATGNLSDKVAFPTALPRSSEGLAGIGLATINQYVDFMTGK